MSVDTLALGIDIGGTGIKGAVINCKTGALVTERLRLPTPQPATLTHISDTVQTLARQFAWRGKIGCTFPAIIDHGKARTAVNVDPSCKGVNLADVFSRATEREVVVLNDADAAGIAELHFGGARNEPGIVIVLTLGTGIGSAVLVDGKLLANTELGQLHYEGQLAEHFISNRTRKEQALDWSEFADRVSELLNYLADSLNPNLFVIGGGVSNPGKAELWMPQLRINVPFKPATLRNNAGIVGAALAAANGIVCEGRVRPF